MRATDDPAARRLAGALTATAASVRQRGALTDALLYLGDAAGRALAASTETTDPHARAHAVATVAMSADDSLGFDVAIETALRDVSNNAPS
ncbi:hypothetical protein [Microcella alkaliphila]|uniref:hypothetical protein n=1 Tax=Microcella alkaliphila TaxID=279828 RepID=UPI001029E2D7|nr:hypothetical protein [Microcella alkaliphila]